MGMSNQSRSPACRRYEALLEDFSNGELSGAHQKKTAEHLRGCSGCREALENARAGTKLFRMAEATADPGSRFALRVMAHIRAEESKRAIERTAFWQPVVSLAWKFAATAMLALVVLLTYAVTGSRKSQPVAQVRQSSAAAEIFSPNPMRPPVNGDEVLMMVAETDYGN